MSGDVVVELRWKGQESFEIEAGDHRFHVDGESASGATPMQHVAVGVGGCMGIDVAHILGKMRTPPDELHVRLLAERATDPPRRFTRMILQFRIVGDVPEANLQRALELSRSTYCSAWASLRPDVELVLESSISRPLPRA